MKQLSKIIRIVLPVLVLGVGFAAAKRVAGMREKPEAQAPEETVWPVEVRRMVSVEAPVQISAQGTTMAAREVQLSSEVAGRILEIHPELVPGGKVKAGDLLVRVDARDYRLALDRRRADIDRAKFSLEVERGQKSVAEREWKQLAPKGGDAAGKALALREPHLRNAKAGLKAAESAARTARLAMERARMKAPFNAVVRTEAVEVGQIARPGQVLASLVGTDVWWVQVSLPAADLEWLEIPGAKTVVSFDRGEGRPVVREGRVARLLPDVGQQGLMARVVVEVPDPLGVEGGDPLLLGAFVRVRIEGRKTQGLRAVPRHALRAKDTVWLANAEDRLHIEAVEVVYREAERVLVRTKLPPEARLITSLLSTPVEGLSLQPQEAPPAAQAAK